MKQPPPEDTAFAPGPARIAAQKAIRSALAKGLDRRTVRKKLARLKRQPQLFADHPIFAALAAEVTRLESARPQFEERRQPAPYEKWGRSLDPASIQQIENACRLPIAVRGALMPDAHLGYGLPIGGVLATRNAVIPYAVGVDIACRVKMTVLDLPEDWIERHPERLEQAIERETRFGIGAHFKKKRQHPVMDLDWNETSTTAGLKTRAWAQLGTSGSGNHFVEWGVLEVDDDVVGLPLGRYLALLSHSGSRGAGARVASHYSKLARRLHLNLPRELTHLAWLDLDAEEGDSYWRAMELMGHYAAANHACIHEHIVRAIGGRSRLEIENHHNFAWKEHHDGEDLVVHRKGATPAGAGAIGIVPGSMADTTFIVRGRGSRAALDSAAHGAGRRMSRRQAHRSFSWSDVRPLLEERRVRLITAGLDEVPMAYKNIHQVMAEQADLVEPIARFHPRIVKMAPAGERPED